MAFATRGQARLRVRSVSSTKGLPRSTSVCCLGEVPAGCWGSVSAKRPAVRAAACYSGKLHQRCTRRPATSDWQQMGTPHLGTQPQARGSVPPARLVRQLIPSPGSADHAFLATSQNRRFVLPLGDFAQLAVCSRGSAQPSSRRLLSLAVETFAACSETLAQLYRGLYAQERLRRHCCKASFIAWSRASTQP
jgi:hypothetical protein